MTRAFPHGIVFCAAVFALMLHQAAGAQVPASVRADAAAGRIDAAVAALQPVTGYDAKALLCSLYASVEQLDDAVHACEAAAAAAPTSSDAQLNLARAYGAKADHSGPLTGLRMVGRIRGAFEKAVQLDGKSIDALSDLGQFYVEAPSVAGGGIDKARPLVTRLQAVSPARAHRLAAMIAAKNHDEATAESEYRAELSASHSPEAYVDLANYYRSRKQYERAEENARLAIEADRAHGPDSLDAASLLIELKRAAPTAQTALRAYLAHTQTGVAGYARAHVLLGNTLRTAGDAAGAQKEYAAALALARNYEPARKAAGQ